MSRKEIPMLYSTMMVLALLAGRKTKTRRTNGLDEINKDPDFYTWLSDYPQIDIPRPAVKYDDRVYYAFTGKYNNSSLVVTTCPYGKPGDLIYAKETHFRFGYWTEVEGGFTKTGKQKWQFIPTTDEVRYIDNKPEVFRKGFPKFDRYGSFWYLRPSLFLPKESGRIWLEVTDIKVERLQDISEEDAIAEGILSYTDEIFKRPRYKDYLADASGYGHPEHDYPTVGVAVTSFATLWQKINGEASWKQNPWVWVVSFKVLSTNGKP